MVTKILLYNSKVNIYVNTNKINSLNDELKNYNDNLEKMVDKKIANIVELKNAVMETIADLVERRDNATRDIEQMILLAQLHIGKIT
jgi:hypothetical protein